MAKRNTATTPPADPNATATVTPAEQSNQSTPPATPADTENTQETPPADDEQSTPTPPVDDSADQGTPPVEEQQNTKGEYQKAESAAQPVRSLKDVLTDLSQNSPHLEQQRLASVALDKLKSAEMWNTEAEMWAKSAIDYVP